VGLITLLVLVGIGVFGWIFWPRSSFLENARIAEHCMSVLACAEMDFQFNDRDQNGVKDYWTGDVSGLFRFGWIDRALAEADARPVIPLVPKPIPLHGYYFVALDLDNEAMPPPALRQETNKIAVKAHHPTRFGFLAYPADSSSGKYFYIISESNTVMRSETNRPPPNEWPSDSEIRTLWSKE